MSLIAGALRFISAASTSVTRATLVELRRRHDLPGERLQRELLLDPSLGQPCAKVLCSRGPERFGLPFGDGDRGMRVRPHQAVADEARLPAKHGDPLGLY